MIYCEKHLNVFKNEIKYSCVEFEVIKNTEQNIKNRFKVYPSKYYMLKTPKNNNSTYREKYR